MQNSGLRQARPWAAIAGLALIVLLLLPGSSQAVVQWGPMRFEPNFSKTLTVPYGSTARVSGSMYIYDDHSSYREVTMGEYMRVGADRHVSMGSQTYTLPYPGPWPGTVHVGFDVPAGPSRQLQFGFWGQNYSGSIPNEESFLDLTVTYRLVLYPSERRVRNGEQVRFTGVMPAFFDAGRPTLLLQVRLGDRWRTFKSMRVADDGTYSSVYRFTRTRRKHVYKFRVKPSGDFFPLALSRSKKARVKVVP